MARLDRMIINSGVTCECTDPGCRGHRNVSHCRERAEAILYRTDMYDESGTAMCDLCADDAFSSGIFTTHEEDDAYLDEFDDTLAV